MNALDFCYPTLAQVPTEAQLSLSTALIGGLFLLICAGVSFFTAWFVAKSQREEKYNFALIGKRFEVNQACYEWAERMAEVYCDEDKKPEVLTGAKKWFHENSLYLCPSVRGQFNEAMRNVGHYDIKIRHAVDTSQGKGAHSDEAVAANEALNEAFKSIKGALKAKLEAEVDGNFWERMK
ncbi:MAG: hypothetical protein P8R37_10455 [Opitutae bacterium]|nr:hypothetical protein [Opitutae bacterium]